MSTQTHIELKDVEFVPPKLFCRTGQVPRGWVRALAKNMEPNAEDWLGNEWVVLDAVDPATGARARCLLAEEVLRPGEERDPRYWMLSSMRENFSAQALSAALRTFGALPHAFRDGETYPGRVNKIAVSEWRRKCGPATDDPLSADAVTVVVHAADSRKCLTRQRLLAKAAIRYFGLINFVLLDDPCNELPRLRHFDVLKNGAWAHVPRFADFDFPDFPSADLDAAEVRDGPVFWSWLDAYARIRLDERWPVDAVAAELLDTRGDRLTDEGDRKLIYHLQRRNEETEERVATLSAAEQDLADKVSTLQADVTAAGRQLAAATGRISCLTRTTEDQAETIRRQQERIDDLETVDVLALLAERAEFQGHVEDLEDRLDTLARLVRHLQRRSDPCAGEVALSGPDEGLPVEWKDLATAAAAAFPRLVVLPEAVRPALGVLDQAQEGAVWLRRTWTALEMLHGYAESRVAGQPWLTARAYVRANPFSGLTEAHVVLTESESVMTNPKLRAARTFPAPGGPMLMPAHIRIGSGRPPAPRLHFHDSVREQGLILIGYIGPHRKSMSTN